MRTEALRKIVRKRNRITKPRHKGLRHHVSCLPVVWPAEQYLYLILHILQMTSFVLRELMPQEAQPVKFLCVSAAAVVHGAGMVGWACSSVEIQKSNRLLSKGALWSVQTFMLIS